METTSKCIKCNTWKPVEEFYRDASRTYKPYRQCNSCAQLRALRLAKRKRETTSKAAEAVTITLIICPKCVKITL